MELSLNINSLEWTIAEMEEVIERLQLEENNSGSPVSHQTELRLLQFKFNVSILLFFPKVK